MKCVRMRVLALSAVTALALIGCGVRTSDSPSAPTELESVADHVSSGLPSGSDFAEYDEWGNEPPILPGWITEPVLGWLTDGETFAVVTWGSSTCVYVATSMEPDGEDRLNVHFTLPAYEVCTDDLTPLTHAFTLPEETTGRPVTVTVTGTDESGWIAGKSGLPEITLTLD